MPILRTYGCYDCSRSWDVTLTAEQVDDPPPQCPFCHNVTRQEFKPVAIAGVAARHRDNAHKMTETIAAEDYHVADMNVKSREGETPKVRYKTDPAATKWIQPDSGLIAEGAAIGRQLRLRANYGRNTHVARPTREGIADRTMRRLRSGTVRETAEVLAPLRFDRGRVGEEQIGRAHV